MTVSKDDLARLKLLVGTAWNALADVTTFVASLTVDPVPVPVPPVPTPTAVIRSAVHRYWLQGPIPTVDFYDLQDSQWIDMTKFPSTAKKFRYVTTCCSPTTDAPGDRQFLKPNVSSPYIAKDTNGRPITRTANKDLLLNVGSPDLRNIIVNNIKNLVRPGGVDKFDGLYMDEVDDTWIYGYPGFGRSGGVATWQNDMLNFVADVSNELHRLKKQLWVNLGLTGTGSNGWRNAIISYADAINIEYFVGKDKLNEQPDTDTDWLNRMKLLADIELMGKPVHAHCSSENGPTIDYAFASWLMGTEFRGSFCASVDYTGDVYGTTTARMTAARQLGRPLGPMGTVLTGYVRNFEHGNVYVNPFSHNMAGMEPMSSKIVVDGRSLVSTWPPLD
jgi:hypothetical protein